MKRFAAEITEWLGALLFVTAATVLWACAAVLVFLSGNGTLHARH